MAERDVAILLAAAIGVLGTLAATALAQRAARRESDRREIAALAQRLENAFVEYLASVDAIVGQVHVFPKSEAKLGPVARVVERLLGDSLHVFVLLLQRLIFGFRWERLLDDFFRANARLHVLAPPLLRARMDEVRDVLASEDIRTALKKTPWRETRERLISTFEMGREK
jgi:hypothetical protein